MRYCLVLIPISLFSTLAQAAPIGAGDLLRQVPPPAAIAPLRAGGSLQQPEADIAKAGPSEKIHVRGFKLTGNKIFGSDILSPLIQPDMGKDLDLDQLNAGAGRITSFYKARGYRLTRAVIPPQEISDGIVEIQIIEARYGEIVLNNSSRLRGRLIESILRPVQSRDPIQQETLETTVAVLAGQPGVKVDADLVASSTFGASDLRISVQDVARSDSQVMVDSEGAHDTGRSRMVMSSNLDNLIGFGDVANWTVMTSGAGVNYGRLAYDLTVNGHGDRAGASVSSMRYKVGGDMKALRAEGTAQTWGLWARSDLGASALGELMGEVRLDHTRLRDRLGGGLVRNDRHLDVVSLVLSGTVRNQSLRGGATHWSAERGQGVLTFDDAETADLDSYTARTAGQFARWSVDIDHTQALTAKDSLVLKLSYQGSAGNLDPAQKFEGGGVYGVRALDTGKISGDSGVLARAEFQRDLGENLGHWTAAPFVEFARVQTNRRPWAGPAEIKTVTGAGLALYGAIPGGPSASFYMAAATSAEGLQDQRLGQLKFGARLVQSF